MKNKWKGLFFTLLGINMIIILFAFSFLFANSTKDDSPFEIDKRNIQSNVPFKLITNKRDLNQLINHYLRDERGDSPLKYELILREIVELNGYIEVLNRTIQVQMTFGAEPLQNGDLLLKQNSLSIGQFQLPARLILNLIHEQYDLPPWITIYPNDGFVHLALTEMELKSNISVAVDAFDLTNDHISFNLIVPMNE